VALLVSIVHYRTPDDVLRCIASLVPQLRALGSTAQAIVVDNCSGDGSAERLRAELASRAWADCVTFVQLPENGGFSYGNNRAIELWQSRHQAAAGDFVLLLNPDTELRPGALGALLNFMAQHPTVGIAGSRLEYEDGRPQESHFRMLGLASELADAASFGPLTRLLAPWASLAPFSEVPVRADWVAGASMLVRWEVFEAIGPMDEGFFLYFEELDFTRRAAKAGWSCWYVPTSRVVHLVGRSTGVTAAGSTTSRLPRYWFDSRKRYFAKHYGVLGALAIDLTWITGHLLGRLVDPVRKRALRRPEHVLGDLVRWNLLRPREALRLPARRPDPVAAGCVSAGDAGRPR
jgi:N-acetylglucosaminyl-diphospho-decaprenol L-rhamnosyltransferase